MIHLYSNDKAIEFNSVYKRLEIKMRKLEEAGIDVQKEKQKALKVKENMEQSVSASTIQMEAESTYQQGIKDLESIEKELEKYAVYYNSNCMAENIEQEINQSELNSEKITAFARATIALINQIQSSDTRAYESKKAVVEKIYNLAYNIIKQELIITGHSSVLDYVKNDDISSSYINSLIEAEVSLLDEESFTNEVIKDTLSTIKQDIENCSYLDEGLILFLALQNQQNSEKLEHYLLEIIKELRESDRRVEQSQYNNSELENKLSRLADSIKKSKIYKEVGLTVSLIALFAGLEYGITKSAAFIGHKEYKTTVDFFTTAEEVEKPAFPEYMKKVSDFSTTTLTAYDVWRQENIFYGEYQREIVTYDLSNAELKSLDDFLSIDFSQMSPRTTKETADKLDAEELYDEAIVEIIRYTQDQEDTQFVPNEDLKKVYIVLASCIAAILCGLGEGFALRSIYKKMKTSKNSIIDRKETLNQLQESLEAYKRLCAENEEFANRFLTMYQKISQYVKNHEIKEEYDKTLKKVADKENA